MALVFHLWFSSQDTKSYRRCEAKAITKNVVAIDCEMVACVPNEEWIKNARKPNKDEVKVAVHCAIVDYNLKVIYEKFVCPPIKRIDWLSLRVKYGMPFHKAREDVLEQLNGKIVVAHN